VAEARKEKEPPLLKDHRYALFTLDSTEEAGLRPVGADEGVFELLSDGSVSPHAYYSWDALQAAKQLNQEQFLSKVQTAAHEEKSASHVSDAFYFSDSMLSPRSPPPRLKTPRNHHKMGIIRRTRGLCRDRRAARGN